MQLTNKQQQGLDIAVSRYKEGKAWTCIAGYAGTGKSTLVKFIIKALDIDEDDVCYVAYTGKASLVLREKGCTNAETAHRLLYKSYPRKDGTFAHYPRRPIPPYKLIVVDEISMLPKTMWDLLLSHHIHVIALGDPGQLPPIGDDNGVLAKPHIFLDEIMRQAQESEIIKLTMDIRAGKPLELFKGNEVQIIDKKDLVSGMFLWADQIICAKNETRRAINALVREYKYGVTNNEPVEGDKIICLHNKWDIQNKLEDVMVNGTLGTINNIHYPNPNDFRNKDLIADILPDGCDEDSFLDPYFRNLHLDYKYLTTGQPTVTKENFKKVSIRPIEIDYGYCITAHKAQGSEYDKVLVFEEYLRGGDHARWLYTAATRAKKKLIIVRA